jgi:hypothetical protein
MTKEILCGSCGNNNPEKNKFCFNCGFKLDNVNTIKQNEKITPDSDFKDIEKLLNDLIQFGGFITIVQDDFYVQFVTTKGTEIIFEAVSRAHLNKVGNKDKEFKVLGFKYEISENYAKTINSNLIGTREIIDEINNIFINIYGISLTNYTFNYEIYYTSNKLKNTNVNVGKKTHKSRSNGNYGYFLGLIAAIILAYFLVENDNKKENHSKQEVVFNSDYDGSVSQVEKYLKKEYLKDPDSYEGISWSSVQTDNSNAQFKYYVRHKFRAKNSFGGYVIEEMMFYLDNDGYVVSVKDF